MSSKSHTDGGHTIIATLRADGITTEIKGTPEFTLKKLKELIKERCVSFNSSTTP